MKRGDIVLVNLPQATDDAGHEQVGMRPALIVHDDATSNTLSVVMIVPFTSNIKAQRFPHNIGSTLKGKWAVQAVYFACFSTAGYR